jgi:four helix bundle protein
MNYQDWEASVPAEIQQDALWQLDVYRLGVFAAELAWLDITHLIDDPRAWGLVDPLHRAVGSISAYVAEGYSMGATQNRARYYEYALGSARESRDWYYQSRHLLGDRVAEHRLRFLALLIRRLLKLGPRRRPTSDQTAIPRR